MKIKNVNSMKPVSGCAPTAQMNRNTVSRSNRMKATAMPKYLTAIGLTLVDRHRLSAALERLQLDRGRRGLRTQHAVQQQRDEYKAEYRDQVKEKDDVGIHRFRPRLVDGTQ